MRSPVRHTHALEHKEIHVWSVALDEVPLDRADLVLDDSELARAARIRTQAGRQRYLSSHVALRTLLAGYLAVSPGLPRFTRRCPRPEICGDCGNGRPELLPGPWPHLDFNLSHSGTTALIALCRTPAVVGVDVERVRPFDWSRLAAVGPVDEVAGFRTWTAIEAVGKAAGSGVRNMATVGEPRSDGVRRARRPGDEADWYVHEVDCAEGYVGSVATRVPRAEVRTLQWPPP
ncbi:MULTISPECIES: 4'-phosphopantetheinyl transferase superfamily protein [unclassified Streptomyces]|uniref:4'-phosphopantetheinyl transferase family protein n=1 Tax=unclassified Streptomyces TaxID=2593676 RepID=UPI00278BCB56|nr:MULTISPECIES: hypothetical protein [unclassified Streptomyces]